MEKQEKRAECKCLRPDSARETSLNPSRCGMGFPANRLLLGSQASADGRSQSAAIQVIASGTICWSHWFAIPCMSASAFMIVGKFIGCKLRQA